MAWHSVLWVHGMLLISRPQSHEAGQGGWDMGQSSWEAELGRDLINVMSWVYQISLNHNIILRLRCLTFKAILHEMAPNRQAGSRMICIREEGSNVCNYETHFATGSSVLYWHTMIFPTASHIHTGFLRSSRDGGGTKRQRYLIFPSAS